MVYYHNINTKIPTQNAELLTLHISAYSLFPTHHPHFPHTFPTYFSKLLSHRFHDHPEIPTHFLNLCWKLQHKTYFSDALFQHTFYKRRRGAFAPLPIDLLPTHSSHLLLYPLSYTLQELFQHIHSVDGKLPHEIICFFQFCLQNSILSFKVLIFSLQTLILVFKIQHLFIVCLFSFSGIRILEVIRKFFCKLCFLNRFVSIRLDKL